MTLHVNVGGVWKTVSAPSVNVGGVWKAVNTAYVNVGGVWKVFHSSVFNLVNTPNILLSDYTKSGAGGTSEVAFTLFASGAAGSTGATQNSPGSWTWRLSGASSDYQIIVSGSASNGGSFSGPTSWTSLSTAQTTSFSTTNNDSDWTGTYSIRLASNGTVVGTGSISMSVATGF